MAVGLPLKTTYANGDVYSASDVNDTNGTINAFLAPSLATSAGKNCVINGGFDVWQRGTSFTGVSPYYSADRWMGSRAGAVAGGTWSRQLTNDTTNLPNIQYCIRIARNSGNTSTALLETTTNFETVNTIEYKGQQVTLSYYARKGANYSGGSLTAILATGTGTDENLVFGYTGEANPISASATLTTTWQRFTATGTIATSANEMAIDFRWTPTGTAGANDYVEITGVQLELGSVATTFARNGATYQAELAACQRYYYRQTGTGNYATFGIGTAFNSTKAFINIIQPVAMRVVPQSIEIPSTITNLKLTNIGSTNYTISNITFVEGTYTNTILEVTASGMTTNQGVWIGNNNTTAGFIGVSAEL